jgi:beta-galactosidase
MKCVLGFLMVPVLASAAVSGLVRITASFDSDWRFLKADAPGAERADFDDSAWRKLNVPHDWSIEGAFDQKNPTGGAGAFLPSGVGWYRKSFSLGKEYAGRRVFIEFDGVMANSDVWINGFHLGKRPYGYVSFAYELSGHLDFLKPNVLAVRADTSSQPASRWYSGAGIYRHVRLIATNAVHFALWTTFVTTPKVSAEEATVRVDTQVVNPDGQPVTTDVAILGPDGEIVASGPGPELVVKHPQLWDLDHPSLYQAVVRVRSGKTVLDDEVMPFGIREFHFDAATGFWLNGRNFKLNGVCLHHDGSAVGAAVPLAVWERRLAVLKQIGVNAIRTAHNPPAPEFLDLCDRMGFLVMDEMFDCWTVAKNPYDYHLYFRDWSREDTADTVRRDRNHPSIVLYSAGNEIHDTPNAVLAKGILKGLVDVFHQYDSTRPVTQALFRPNVSHDYEDGLADLLDVVGQNYREREILAAHQQKPTRKIVGTENAHDRNQWVAVRDNPPYSGQFLWAGIDYLGESRQWPTVAAASGLLDRTAGMKPAGYERQSWWSAKPMVYVTRRVAPRQAAPTDPGYEPGVRRQVQTQFPDWTPAHPDPQGENVEVYSNCEEVELVLNGKSLGSKPINADASPRNWRIPFEPGRLQAIGRSHGEVAATFELRTAGKPAKIALATDRTRLGTGWDDVAFVTARVLDENGVEVPGADASIAFEVTGPGTIAATDSADNRSHEAFQAKKRRAYQGRCEALVRANGKGEIVVKAASEGLEGASVRIAGVEQ